MYKTTFIKLFESFWTVCGAARYVEVNDDKVVRQLTEGGHGHVPEVDLLWDWQPSYALQNAKTDNKCLKDIAETH